MREEKSRPVDTSLGARNGFRVLPFRDQVVGGGGTGLALRVREGSEAEARRVVELKPLLQIAINESFCSFTLGRGWLGA